MGAHAGRGLQASGVSHHMGKKLGPAGAPVGIWARPEEEVVWCFRHCPWAGLLLLRWRGKGPFNLRTSDKEVKSGIFNLWVYNKDCGLAAKARGWENYCRERWGTGLRCEKWAEQEAQVCS